MPKKEWFAEWFDSPYYHLLYQNRNDDEAKVFIEKLCAYLQLAPQIAVLDLACGKGRHSITLAKLGYQVTGADLAPNSIQLAKQAQAALSLSNLDFIVHDMRQPIANNRFGAVFNLFTSFGYFDDLHDNQRVCSAIAEMLEPDGVLVIDFLNAQKVVANLVESEIVMRGETRFDIKRWATASHIYKQIEIRDPQQEGLIGPFTERVQALRVADFQVLLAPNFELIATLGDYQLETFDEANSDRLILIAKKKP
ncbi:MAG: class I SAM-dependent methyltransferase [Flavobacteriales bacterium]